MSTIACLRPSSLLVIKDQSMFGQHATTVTGNCERIGFAGSLSVVAAEDLIARRTLRSAPDMAAVLVDTGIALETCDMLCRLGVSTICVVSGGYPSSPKISDALRAGMKTLSAKYGTVFIGHSGGGVVDTVSRCAPFAGNVSAKVRAGSVGLVAQGGAVIEAFTTSDRVALSSAISCGTSATFDVTTALEYFVDDTETQAVLAFVEGVDNGERLVRAARALKERGKPLAVLKVGRSPAGLAGVVAHSELYAGNDRVFDAAMHSTGAVVCEDLDELVAVGEVYSAERRPRGPTTHVVAYSGAEANLIADMAHRHGLRLPAMSKAATSSLQDRWPHLRVANPLDPWHIDDPVSAYAAALEVCASEAGDIVMLVMDQSIGTTAQAVALSLCMVHLLHEHVVGTGKLPVLLSSVSQDPPDPIKQLCAQLDITLLRGAQAAIAAMSKVAGVGRPRWETDTTVVRGQPGAVSSIRTTTWDEHASLGLLEEHGFRTARRRAVTRVDDALDAAATLGYPVVVKGLRKDVLHKQECGLVRLNVTDDRILRNAVDAMQGSEAGQSDTTVLIEEQVHGNVEIFLGMVRDPVFGQVLLLGPGGQWVDIADEIAVSLEPGAEGVATMLDDSVLGQILRRRHDITAASKMLAEAADGLWQLMATNPQILTIDVNPFIVTDDAIVAVDALVVQGGQP